jgi:WhiB family transcriptional regulator, redox-sensing transcriptional regulator
MSWRDEAGCLGMDYELFFPLGSTGPAVEQIARAKAVCQDCPVMQECLEWALRTGQYGIWGGQTEDERHALRRKRRRGKAQR